MSNKYGVFLNIPFRIPENFFGIDMNSIFVFSNGFESMYFKFEFSENSTSLRFEQLLKIDLPINETDCGIKIDSIAVFVNAESLIKHNSEFSENSIVSSHFMKLNKICLIIHTL